MSMRKLGRPFVGLVLFSVGMASGLLAQTGSDVAQRVELKRVDLSGAPNMEVITSISEYQPGEVLQRHFHHGVEAAYVVQGAKVQSAGHDPVQLATGTSIINLRDVPHGGMTVVGDTPLKLYTVHIVDKGKLLYDFSGG